MLKSKILFQMTGSIACYKACSVLSKLVQAGHDVQVVASPSALKFVASATLEGLTGRPVVSDVFQAGHMMDHIHLVRWADLVIVAPATANFINKISLGVGDDLLTTQFLAHDFKKPFLLAPAMNTAMYQHPATQKSIQRLKEMGVKILETASGVLACGEVGWGRLLEPDLIFQEIEKNLKSSPEPMEKGPLPVEASSLPVKKSNKAVSILITSGGTQEPLDPVRFLTNSSTGSTGAALADLLSGFGFDVTYLHARNAVQPLSDCKKFSFQTFEDLQNELQNLLSEGSYHAVIHAAAVSDFSPANARREKIPSSENLVIEFKRNPKLVDLLRGMARDPKLKVIAFKMTATPSLKEREQAVQKLFSHSKADIVVHNDLSEIDPSRGRHSFHVHDGKGPPQDLGSKQELGFYLSEYLTKEFL